MYGNGRPLGMRKRMQVVVMVVLLAWATQTLLRQWGFGAEIAPVPTASASLAALSASPSAAPTEQFVPSQTTAQGGTLELRGDATILGPDVHLRQICRWADSDARFFRPVADLVVLHIDHGSPFRAITVKQIKTTLHDAGMNLAMVDFAGPMACTVTRSDASYNEQDALRQWAQAKSTSDAASAAPIPGGPSASTPAASSASAQTEAAQPAGARVSAAADAVDDSRPKTLRRILVDDLSIRLGVPLDRLEVTFNPADEKLLNLSQPLFKFNIEPRQVRNLGQVSWNVLILTGAGSQHGVITANARAWQNQIVLNKPLAYQQVIQSSDVTQRRVLSDHLPDEPLLDMPQVVGQEASRDLRIGAVISNRMVNATPLVKPGQLVTVTLTVGSVRVKTVGRAIEEGCYGQAVKVKNETTRDVFEVVMTGPQEGTLDPLPRSSSKVMASSAQVP